jgi:hypothetical protein
MGVMEDQEVMGLGWVGEDWVEEGVGLGVGGWVGVEGLAGAGWAVVG